MKLQSGKYRLIVICASIIAGLFGSLAVGTVIFDLNRWEAAYNDCPAGSECDQMSKLFVKDYEEAKDLAKSFLTLLVAVFVGSITFSEKIVNVHDSGVWSKAAMITCWVALLLAIVTCGTGITYMVVAYGTAVYYPTLDYRFHETRAAQLFVVSGISFGVALCTMLLAGLSTFFDPKIIQSVSLATDDILLTNRGGELPSQPGNPNI
jgi:hypothetical protein